MGGHDRWGGGGGQPEAVPVPSGKPDAQSWGGGGGGGGGAARRQTFRKSSLLLAENAEKELSQNKSKNPKSCSRESSETRVFGERARVTESVFLVGIRMSHLLFGHRLFLPQ